VLSASHNPFEDNGIKIFSSEGAKFPDAWEEEIEARLSGPDTAPWPTGVDIGRLVIHEAAEADYIAHARATCPHDLQGLRVVLDCAHGATYRVAPEIFRRLGADVRVLNASPDGLNINRGVGAMHPEGLQKEVLRARAQLGLAFDGDGDRLISVDETGQIRDGDYALAICGRHLAARGLLKSGTVVTTVMANLALDRVLTTAGIGLAKVAVGDRYVLEEMLRIGANLGGEQSGHLLFLDHATTGDGIVSALQLIGVMRESGVSLGDLSRCLVKFPQVLLNVPVKQKPPVDSIPGLVERARGLETEMNGAGRILLRYSGTESLLRVMIEGEEQARIEGMAEELAGIIRRAIGA
jgi:phosphoglucosamine mutase